jgi:integrase
MANETPTDWKGSIVHMSGRRKLYAHVKGPKGWQQIPIDFYRGQEREARAFLRKLVKAMKAGEELGVPGGAMTVRQYAVRWIERRKQLGIVSVDDDQSHLNTWIYPARVSEQLPPLGALPLRDVEPRHLVRVVEKMRAASKAPRTVRNVYSTCKALFRDAEIDGLIDRGTSPCILTVHQLGSVKDAVAGWRATAVFNKDELEELISDPRVPWDRRVLYAVLFLTGLRHGEAARLRWENYDATIAPLGKLIVLKSKTDVERHVPVLVPLAGILAEWKLQGWPQLMGRAPLPGDLLLPAPAGRRVKLGHQRSDHDTYKRLLGDLWIAAAGASGAAHDMRRTFISLARAAGVDKDAAAPGHARPAQPRRNGAVHVGGVGAAL